MPRKKTVVPAVKVRSLTTRQKQALQFLERIGDADFRLFRAAGIAMPIVASLVRRKLIMSVMQRAGDGTPVRIYYSKRSDPPESLPTPAPWPRRRLRDADGNAYDTLYQAHIDLGACMIWCPEGNVRQEANSRLIQASPNLLRACELLLLSVLDNSVSRSTAIRYATAAIQQVRGNRNEG